MLNSLTTRTKSLTTSWSGQNFHPDRRWEKPDGFLAWEHPDAPRNGQPLLWQGLLYVCGGRDEQREPLSSLDLREKHRLLSVLQCFTMVYLVPLSSHMFEKALMIGFLSFKRPLSSPCQSRHDDCPKTFHSLRCGTLESFPEHLASVCASAAVDKNENLRSCADFDLRLPAMSSQRAGGVGKC